MGAFPIIATIVSTILAGGLGALWYGPLFGEAWLKAVGKNEEDIDSSPKPIIVAMVTWLVSAIVFSTLVVVHSLTGFGALVQMAALGWLGFGLVPMVLSITFQEKAPAFLWIDGSYHLCGWLLMALAHTVFQQVL